MSEIRRLQLQYKGDRAYLHGSDIFDAVNGLASGLHHGYVSRIAFRRLATHALAVVDELPASGIDPVADITVSSRADNAVVAKWWLVETDVPVQGRYAYDEHLIAQACEVDGRARCLAKLRDVNFTLIEEVVAAHKVLCGALATEAGGRWLFAQLLLSTPLEGDVSKIELTNTALLNGKMAASDLRLDGAKVGSIRFMRG
ncbi:hypothetical protein NGA35_02430 [Pseudomonas stutzeri]|nr:hypothetical protein [Stutzerimonas stutzeri]